MTDLQSHLRFLRSPILTEHLSATLPRAGRCQRYCLSFSVLTLSLLLLATPPVVSADDKCKLKALKVKGNVVGKALMQNQGERQPLSGVDIAILSKSDRKLVASAGSDETGGFMVRDLEPGKYWIKTTHPVAAGIEVELEVSAAGDGKGVPDRMIVLVLGTDESKPCGGARVETSKIK
ncbi:MAG: SpaA isopeptide-forming pilin-related protein [Pyrinomonadaceae bacterium]